MLITSDIQKTIGASNQEADMLGFIAHVLTNSNPGWISDVGDGSGAWGVSQKWHGVVTPRDSVPLQAAQALGVLRGLTANMGAIDDWPGPVCYYAALLRLWWHPGDMAIITQYRHVQGQYPTASQLGWPDSTAKSWIGITSRAAQAVKTYWPWVLAGLAGLGLSIYLLSRRKSK